MVIVPDVGRSSMKKVSLVRTYTSRDGVDFETDRTFLEISLKHLIHSKDTCL